MFWSVIFEHSCSEGRWSRETLVRIDICSDGHFIILTDVQIDRKKNCQIFFKILFKTPLLPLPEHKESIGILGDQI